MYLCHHCKVECPEQDFYASSLRKQDYICKRCSVKVGRTNRLKRIYDNPLREKYLYAKNSAKSNKKPFSLTEAEYFEIASKPCFYCTLPIKEFGIGLDRINNDKSIGYTITNVLPCCEFCNKIRNNLLTVEEAKVAIDAVMEFRKLSKSFL